MWARECSAIYSSALILLPIQDLARLRMHDPWSIARLHFRTLIFLPNPKACSDTTAGCVPQPALRISTTRKLSIRTIHFNFGSSSRGCFGRREVRSLSTEVQVRRLFTNIASVGNVNQVPWQCC